jgi:hypothetical protein
VPENFYGRTPGLLLSLVQRIVNDALGSRSFATNHDAVDELGQIDAAEFRVGCHITLVWSVSTHG